MYIYIYIEREREKEREREGEGERGSRDCLLVSGAEDGGQR